VIITRPGGPEVLELRTIRAPAPGVHEVLIRVHATALNRADLLQRQGRYPAPPGSPQDIPGMEFAGEVVRLGPEARRWPVGARVFGIVGGGAYAELATAHEDTLARIPDSLGWTDAAAVPEAFITAHDALVTQGLMQSGDTVLIHAVASGVGLAGVQIARAWGASAYGTTRSKDKLARAGALGLADGLVVTTSLDALEPAVTRWTNGHGMDITLELVGGAYLVASISAAAHKGRIILVGTLGGGSADIPLGVVMRKRLMIRGTMLRSRSIAEKIDATERFTREIVPLFATKRLQPVVDCVMPLEQVVEAHRLMESNQTVGKIVMQL
jgi:NADPH2:quinone reductase